MRRLWRTLVPLAGAAALAACATGPADPVEPAGPTCPESGVRMEATSSNGSIDGAGFAAIALANCGTGPVELTGRAEAEVILDGGADAGVRAVAGQSGAAPLTIEAGDFAFATLSWDADMAAADSIHSVLGFDIAPAPGLETQTLWLYSPIAVAGGGIVEIGAWQASALHIEDEPVAEGDDETPAGAICPVGDVRIGVSGTSAAMGLRAQGIELVNCGDEPIELNGYPHLDLPGVDIVEGTSDVDDPGPQPITVEPGGRATAAIVWRNTVEAGEAVTITELKIGTAAGAPTQTVYPENHLDIGTTGRIELSAWQSG